MSKTYEIAPKEVNERAKALIADHYEDLDNAGVTIVYLFAVSTDEKPAIMHHGYPALGLCRIVNLKDRAKKIADAEITLDGTAWKNMKPEQRDALLDHELNHLIVQRDPEGAFKSDDLHRPQLKIRKHDFEMGWFTCIAERHGINSPEVYQAKILWDEAGQAFFPMLIEDSAETKKAKAA